MESIGKAILDVAPVLANALLPGSGIVAGAALSAVGKALGLSDDDARKPDAVQAAVTKATPEQLAAIKRADIEFRKLDLAELRVRVDDRKSARRTWVKTKSPLVGLLAVMVVGAFCAVAGFVMFVLFAPSSVSLTPSTEVMYIAFTLIGALGTQANNVLSFFFGSSKAADEQAAHFSERLAKGLDGLPPAK